MDHTTTATCENPLMRPVARMANGFNLSGQWPLPCHLPRARREVISKAGL